MLPKSVHSLAEIAMLDLPIDRARELGLLFEHVLKRTTPDWRSYKFHELISLHRLELPNFAKLEAAREARNAIVHGDRLTERTILQAEAEFQFAIESILRVCPEAVQLDVRGTAAPPPPPPPPKKPADVSEQTGQGPPPPTLPSLQFPTPPQSSFLPPAPPEPPRELPQTIWFVLSAAFVLVAIFLYVAQPSSEQAKTFPPRDPPGGSGTVSPPVGSSARREGRAEISSAPPPSREAVFKGLINSNLSVSSSQPNLALLVDSSGPSTSGSVNDSLSGFLSDTKLRIVANLADLNALKTQGFFDDLFGGNSRFLSQAAQLSHVDYILLGKATYSFRPQPELDPDLTTCDLSLTSRLSDRSGTVVRAESFSTTGPGFTAAQALERATENAAQHLKEKILDAIR
jgi:hypothetical protein